MPKLDAVLKPYQDVIIQESNDWIMSGRPIPLFMLCESEKDAEKRFGEQTKQNIAPPDSAAALFAFDLVMATHKLGRELDEVYDKFREGPSKRFASVLIEMGGESNLMRIDIPRANTELDEEIDAQKVGDLHGLLDSYLLASISKGKQRKMLAESFRTDAENFLTRLLQRPPTQTEVEEVMVDLKAN